MPSIGDAVSRLQTADLPVLFADTCCLLDVIRAPMRPAKLSGCVQAAVELSRFLSDSPARCRLVLPSFVQGEWLDHAASEQAKLKNHFAQLDDFATDFHDTCSFLAISTTFGRPDYANAGLANRLFDLSKSLSDSAIHLEPQDDTNMRAFGRAIRCTPPSKKGGEVKDCTILEECLEVCRQLRAAAFVRNLVFCTSNTDDYCEGKTLHPAIAKDFTPIGLAFATNLSWATHELMK
jgi:hypothetical protein